MAGQLQWHDEEIVIRGEANHQLGIMRVTITCFCVQQQNFELRLAWEFFTPQRILLSAGLVGGLRTRTEAFRQAEERWLLEINNSKSLKELRQAQGWVSLH